MTLLLKMTFLLQLKGLVKGPSMQNRINIKKYFSKGNVVLSLSHLKVALIGIVIVGGLLTSSKGFLPAVPSRPKRPVGQAANLDEEESRK